jgi:3-methylfumaryl-CoA hydratase
VEPADLNEAHLRDWIGREEVVRETLGAETVRRFDATFGRTGSDLEAGAEAPPLIHWCLGQPAAATSALGEDGHPARGGFMPPVPLPRRMWAASSIAFHAPIRIGDTVTRVSRIADISVKRGRSGVLCFVTVQHEADVDGRPILSETQSIVYRPAETTPAPAAPPAAERGTERMTVEPTPPLLFRYSALTFNGHRIHYDRTYATTVENYPGLVVHGPLQATLLMLFASGLRSRPPTRFSFRAQTPVFDDRPLLLNARDGEGGTLKLWTAAAGGPLAVSAEAAWA